MNRFSIGSEAVEKEENIVAHFAEFEEHCDVSSMSAEDIFRHGYMFGAMDARFIIAQLFACGDRDEA